MPALSRPGLLPQSHPCRSRFRWRWLSTNHPCCPTPERPEMAPRPPATDHASRDWVLLYGYAYWDEGKTIPLHRPCFPLTQAMHLPDSLQNASRVALAVFPCLPTTSWHIIIE